MQSAYEVYDGTQTRVKEYTAKPRERFETARESTTSTVSEGWSFYKDNGLKGCTSSLVDKLGKTSENLQKTAVSTTASLYTYSVETAESSWTYLSEKPASTGSPPCMCHSILALHAHLRRRIRCVGQAC